ncbi:MULTISPECIES: hypothetical protein [unclassified Nocardiopsis]
MSTGEGAARQGRPFAVLAGLSLGILALLFAVVPPLPRGRPR